MQSQELHVRQVAGRYGRGPLRSGNIVTTVTEIARVYSVRIDDSANPDAWLELTIEVETPDGVPRRVQQAG
jgi:hypothetical protein